MGRNFSKVSPRNRTDTIEVNSLWLSSITKYFDRFISLRRIYLDMITLLPTADAKLFEARFRAIDAGGELQYHVAQGDKTNNGTTKLIQTSQVLSPISSPCGDDEA